MYTAMKSICMHEGGSFPPGQQECNLFVPLLLARLFGLPACSQPCHLHMAAPVSLHPHVPAVRILVRAWHNELCLRVCEIGVVSPPGGSCLLSGALLISSYSVKAVVNLLPVHPKPASGACVLASLVRWRSSL